jgi:hypothetical protein
MQDWFYERIDIGISFDLTLHTSGPSKQKFRVKP